ncbi:MAG: hypothetical protein AAB486_02690 [Patescibacteria group bacterium]
MSTMYMFNRKNALFGVACYGKFLLEALRPSGVKELPEFDHGFYAWQNSVVFFDTAGWPVDWLEMVTHYTDQDNIVVVIYDEVEKSGELIDTFAGAWYRVVLLPRTWEADQVRGFFNTADNMLKELSA